MTKVPSAAAVEPPAANRASIVFVRDSFVAYAVNFAVIDHAGNFLGDAVARSHFALELPPGRYFFFAKSNEATDAIQAEVAAGSVYYVRVIPRAGMWTARLELDPIKPGEADWPRLATWLGRSNRLAPAIPKLPSPVSETPLPDWAAKAWAALSAEEQATRSLTPTDGFAVNVVQPALPSAPIAAAH